MLGTWLTEGPVEATLFVVLEPEFVVELFPLVAELVEESCEPLFVLEPVPAPVLPSVFSFWPV